MKKILIFVSIISIAYDKVTKLKSDLEPEVDEKFMNIHDVKEIIKEWKMNI